MSEKRKFLACKLLYILGALLGVGAIIYTSSFFGELIGVFIAFLIFISPFMVLKGIILFGTDYHPKDLYKDITFYGSSYMNGLEKIIKDTENIKDLIKPYEEYSVKVRRRRNVYVIKDKYNKIRISNYSLNHYDFFKDYYLSLCPTVKELSDYIESHKASVAKREFDESINKERINKIKEILNKQSKK